MEELLERCTAEKLTGDRWDLILRICEEYGTPQPKPCLKAICKRIFHKSPNVSLHAITLLDACSKNCGKSFNREIASKDFIQHMKNRFSSLPETSKLKLTELFERWAEDFKSDSELSFASSLYDWVNSEHADMTRRLNDIRQAAKTNISYPNVTRLQAKEEEDLAKAIALSLKESENKSPVSHHKLITSQSTHVCDNTTQSSVTTTQGHVRALYDFEAAEDNELTFKANEIIVLLDDSDENWWYGSNHRGKGFFPAQFVQRETNCSPISNHTIPQTSTSVIEPPKSVQLDAHKLDRCLHLIGSIDPTGEYRPDPVELPALEAECLAMAPLIDEELKQVDKHAAILSDLHQQLWHSLAMYHDLMSQPPGGMTNTYYGSTGLMGVAMPTNTAYVPQPGSTYATAMQSTYGMMPDNVYPQCGSITYPAPTGVHATMPTAYHYAMDAGNAPQASAQQQQQHPHGVNEPFVADTFPRVVESFHTAPNLTNSSNTAPINDTTVSHQSYYYAYGSPHM